MIKSNKITAITFSEVKGLNARAVFTIKKKYNNLQEETIEDWTKIMKKDKIY